MRAFAPRIDVTAFANTGWGVDEISARYEDVLWRHPEIFYVNKVRRLTWRTKADGSLTEVEITGIAYDANPEDVAEKAAALETVVQAALSRVDGRSDAAEKACGLHDFLRERCTYDSAGLKEKTPRYRTAYEALVRGRAVCEGYAMAYRLLLDRVGISSRIAVSEAMNHCWNVVYVNGAWRHVDVTRDDPRVSEGNRLKTRLMGRRYCLLSDVALRRKGHHDWVLRG